MPRTFSALRPILALVTIHSVSMGAGVPEVGEPVRLTKRETLLLNGKTFAQASKGQEFTVLKREPGTILVSYLKEDGTAVGLSLPSDSVEAVPAASWEELIRGMRAFRDQRPDAAKVYMARAAQDKDQAALANALAARVNGALTAATQVATPAGKQALINTIQVLRDSAEQLAKADRVSLAAAMDEGAERLGTPLLGASLPPSKINRAELATRSATAERAYIRARQFMGEKKLISARRLVDEGLEAEASHPGLKSFQPLIKKGVEDAEELYETANKMKRFDKGAVHALSAIDDGLKLCADHPRLRTLRSEMNAQFEVRTSPQVDAAFLSASKAKASKEVLEDGRKIYTSRCAECHDLEMLDSRSVSGWDRIVSGMARRAGLTAAEKDRVMNYLTAAVAVVESSQ